MKIYILLSLIICSLTLSNNDIQVALGIFPQPAQIQAVTSDPASLAHYAVIKTSNFRVL
jgi:hypothetical protein